jgi:uncharacterized protein (DUF2141 family)
VAIAVAALIEWSCAVVLPPSGGPEDRTPPHVESCNVPNGALGVGRSVAVEIVFSEYVERSDVARGIFVTPRAPMQLDWSGRRLTIVLDSLRDSTTYRLSIAATYRDLRGNRASEPLSLVFSTGDHLDSCRIVGTIVASTAQPLFALVIPRDTEHQPLRYVVPAAAGGSFIADALPCDSFIVAAFADVNGNGEYDRGEWCGVASKAVAAGVGTSSPSLRLWLSPPPVGTPVSILDARAVSSRRIRVRLSQPLQRVARVQWRLTDSSERKTIGIAAVLARESDRIELVPSEQLAASRRYVLSLAPDADLRDTTGARLIADTTAVTFDGADAADSMRLGVASIVPQRDTTRDVGLLPSLHVIWSDALDRLPTIALVESRRGIALPLAIERYDDAHIVARPLDSLNPATQYVWRVQLDSTRSWRGVPSSDTGIVFRTIVTLDTRNGGSIRGVVEDSCCGCRHRVVVARNGRGEIVATALADSTGRFAIPYLPEGSYRLDAFCDTDGNGRFDGGCIEPLRFGEPVALESVTVSVKARWETDGVTIRLQR